MKNKLVLGLITVVVIGLVGYGAYYIFNSGGGETKKSTSLFEFRVMDETLDQQNIDDWTAEFEEVKKALEADPQDVYALFRVGRLKRLVGDYEGSEQAYSRLLEIEPQNGTAYNNLGSLYGTYLMDYPRAEETYKKAIEYSLGGTRALIYYRNLYDIYFYTTKEFDKAEALLLEALENYPKSSEFMILTGQFYKSQGELEKALSYYESALDSTDNKESLEKEIESLKQQMHQ